MAGLRVFTVLPFLLLVCIAASPALAVTSTDGRPRPTGYPDAPTMSYGATPPCYLNSAPVTCEWYGFSHILYPTQGASCLTYTRRVLSNTTAVQPGDLVPYEYYYLSRFVFDTTTNTSYCLYGCFDMGASTPSSSPPAGFAPSPATVATPPPATIDSPPPATIGSPPPATIDSPPPATFDSPPPPGFTPSEMPPPDASLTPPPPAAVTPPPPGSGTRVINVNGAEFLQPTALVSLFVVGALLVLNGVVAF